MYSTPSNQHEGVVSCKNALPLTGFIKIENPPQPNVSLSLTVLQVDCNKSYLTESKILYSINSKRGQRCNESNMSRMNDNTAALLRETTQTRLII